MREKETSEKSIIVIGAGLAGLSAGCYAQMNGYRTQIFEHHSVPGGVAATWKRAGYTIDGGIHFIMGHKPGSRLYQLYRELGTAQANRFIETPVYVRFIDEANSRSLVVTQDLDRLASDLKAYSPADSQVIDELIAGARIMQGHDMSEMGLNKPPEITSPLEQMKEMWQMRPYWKYFTGKYAQSIEDYTKTVHDPWLREYLKNMFLPEVPVWFLFMLLGLHADGQLGLLENGSRGFVLPIEKRYKTLGGQVHYKATVEKILVKGDTAIGVRLLDGSEHYADVVVSAADGHSTIFEMLNGRYVNKKLLWMYREWKLMRPFVMASYGVAREFKEEPWLSMTMLKRPFSAGQQTIKGLMLRIFNYSTKFAPPGKTVVQVSFETEWDYWNELHKDQGRYEAEKVRVAKDILQRLETYYSGISPQVETTDVTTPYTTWRYTRNYKGAYEGWLPTPKAMITRVPKTLPGLANFYMAGQWTMPGGGVPPCLYSGRHVVQILCKKDKKVFVTML